jgi:serine O-acetyltransferase
MIKSKEDYLKFLVEDKNALGIDSRSAFILDPIWSFQRLLRKIEYYQNCKKDIFSGFYLYILKYRFLKISIRLGFSIYPNTFDYGLNIAHYGDIVVNGNAKVGKYCRIHSGVCIGEVNGHSPVIKDYVYIGPGSKVLGDVIVQKNSVITANSVVVNSIDQEGVTLGGIPAKVISENDSSSLLYSAAKF